MQGSINDHRLSVADNKHAIAYAPSRANILVDEVKDKLFDYRVMPSILHTDRPTLHVDLVLQIIVPGQVGGNVIIGTVLRHCGSIAAQTLATIIMWGTD